MSPWRGLEGEPSSAYFGAWIESHIRPNRARNTARMYEQIVRLHIEPLLGEAPLRDITTADIEAVIVHQAESGAGRGTVDLTLKTLVSALEHAVRLGLLERNVARGVRVPRMAKPRPVVLQEQEAAALIVQGPRASWYGNAFALALLTGMRAGELRGLRWRSVRLERARAEIDVVEQQIDMPRKLPGGEPSLEPLKSVASARTLHLGAAGAAILTDQRQRLGRHAAERSAAGKPWHGYGLVFPAKDGGVTSRGALNVTLRGVCEVLGLPRVTVHGLRHTHATLLRLSGSDLVDIQHQLGHRNLKTTTDQYLHPTISSRERTGELAERAIFGRKADGDARGRTGEL